MAKKKSAIRKVVETVEGWVGVGPEAQKKKPRPAKKATSKKAAKKGAAVKRKKTTKKKTAKKR
jgi:hypothetical protein